MSTIIQFNQGAIKDKLNLVLHAHEYKSAVAIAKAAGLYRFA